MAAVGPSPDPSLCRISNLEASDYPEETFSVNITSMDITSSEHTWVSYVKCGFFGVLEKHVQDKKGLVMMVHGTVPKVHRFFFFVSLPRPSFGLTSFCWPPSLSLASFFLLACFPLLSFPPRSSLLLPFSFPPPPSLTGWGLSA